MIDAIRKLRGTPLVPPALFRVDWSISPVTLRSVDRLAIERHSDHHRVGPHKVHLVGDAVRDPVVAEVAARRERVAVAAVEERDTVDIKVVVHCDGRAITLVRMKVAPPLMATPMEPMFVSAGVAARTGFVGISTLYAESVTGIVVPSASAQASSTRWSGTPSSLNVRTCPDTETVMSESQSAAVGVAP